jgi:hypothetical protein
VKISRKVHVRIEPDDIGSEWPQSMRRFHVPYEIRPDTVDVELIDYAERGYAGGGDGVLVTDSVNVGGPRIHKNGSRGDYVSEYAPLRDRASWPAWLENAVALAERTANGKETG